MKTQIVDKIDNLDNPFSNYGFSPFPVLVYYCDGAIPSLFSVNPNLDYLVKKAGKFTKYKHVMRYIHIRIYRNTT